MKVVNSIASRYCPIVVELPNEDGTEWGVGFGHFNPEEKDYVAVKDRDEAFKLHAIVSGILANCSGPLINWEALVKTVVEAADSDIAKQLDAKTAEEPEAAPALLAQLVAVAKGAVAAELLEER